MNASSFLSGMILAPLAVALWGPDPVTARPAHVLPGVAGLRSEGEATVVAVRVATGQSDKGSGVKAERRRGLVRIAPQRGDGVQREPFEAERWRSALSEPNLDLRERELDRLLERARSDAEAWDFLRDLAADDQAGELAWTARLALRELENQPRNVVFRPFAGPRFRLSDPFTDLDEMLQDFGLGDLGIGGGVVPLVPSMPSAREGRGGSMPGGGSFQMGSERRVEIQNDGQTWSLRIHDVVDGKETLKEYEGESLEAILEANPELHDQLGVSHLGAEPEGFRLDTGLPLQGGSVQELFQGLRGLDGALPSQGFLWKNGGTPGRLQVFVRPQSHSQPLRTDKLGVRVVPITPDHAAELNLEEGVGLYVHTSFPGTIAHLLGVRNGDVLLELDGRILRSVEDITVFMEQRGENDHVRLAWIDGDGEQQDRAWYPDGKVPEDF